MTPSSKGPGKPPLNWPALTRTHTRTQALRAARIRLRSSESPRDQQQQQAAKKLPLIGSTASPPPAPPSPTPTSSTPGAARLLTPSPLPASALRLVTAPEHTGHHHHAESSASSSSARSPSPFSAHMMMTPQDRSHGGNHACSLSPGHHEYGHVHQQMRHTPQQPSYLSPSPQQHAAPSNHNQSRSPSAFNTPPPASNQVYRDNKNGPASAGAPRERDAANMYKDTVPLYRDKDALSRAAASPSASASPSSVAHSPAHMQSPSAASAGGQQLAHQQWWPHAHSGSSTPNANANSDARTPRHHGFTDRQASPVLSPQPSSNGHVFAYNNGAYNNNGPGDARNARARSVPLDNSRQNVRAVQLPNSANKVMPGPSKYSLSLSTVEATARDEIGESIWSAAGLYARNNNEGFNRHSPRPREAVY
jgi:hypothetical protein